MYGICATPQRSCTCCTVASGSDASFPSPESRTLLTLARLRVTRSTPAGAHASPPRATAAARAHMLPSGLTPYGCAPRSKMAWACTPPPEAAAPFGSLPAARLRVLPGWLMAVPASQHWLVARTPRGTVACLALFPPVLIVSLAFSAAFCVDARSAVQFIAALVGWLWDSCSNPSTAARYCCLYYWSALLVTVVSNVTGAYAMCALSREPYCRSHWQQQRRHRCMRQFASVRSVGFRAFAPL